VVLGIATATVVVPFTSRDARAVRPLLRPSRDASTRFDRKQSAALFVGVRQFASDAVVPVPFAVDDAVDLAYVFALERRVALVPARRVVLALSGRPVKQASRERLRALRDAGADVRSADASGIRAALREQSALAGRDGMLIVSVATHGFLRDGNGYILAASSSIGRTESMLSANEVFETIATSAAQRSLVFVDACRERLTGTRGAASARSAAPIVRRLSRARGQVVFYAAAAGQWAYDDADARNGVFTKAVIAGINCGAAKVRGMVTAETLAGFVERNVRMWIVKNQDPAIGSATQVSMDGEARNMPLAQCWGVPPLGPARVTADGSMIRAWSDSGRQLWQRDAGGAVARVEASDLDADGMREVVYATADTIAVLDDGGNPLWSARDAATLSAFVTGDLFRQPTNEIVVLRNAAQSSFLTIYAADGSLLGRVDPHRRIDRIKIGRATNRHAPRILATSGNLSLVFDPKKLAAGKPLWAGRVSRKTDGIAALDVVDGNGDGKREICLTTASGAKVFVDFSGHAIRSMSSARFERVAPSRLR